MSERGTFVTNNILCDACLEKLRDYFKDRRTAPHWSMEHMIGGWMTSSEIGGSFLRRRFFAGGVNGLYAGQEVRDFRNTYGPEIAKLGLCHGITFAIVGDNGHGIFLVKDELVTEIFATPFG